MAQHCDINTGPDIREAELSQEELMEKIRNIQANRTMAFGRLNGATALVYTQFLVIALAMPLKELCSRRSQFEGR